MIFGLSTRSGVAWERLSVPIGIDFLSGVRAKAPKGVRVLFLDDLIALDGESHHVSHQGVPLFEKILAVVVKAGQFCILSASLALIYAHEHDFTSKKGV